MFSYEHENTGRKPYFIESLFIIVLVAVLILISVQVFEQDAHVPLVIGAMVAAAMSMFVLKIKWVVLEEGILNAIIMGMQACLILYTVGALIGTWIQTGTVPTMIYYGLGVLRPSIFLVASMLICSVVSLSTGSSWGTTGTIGLALMGIGIGLGIPEPVTAGFVISGAYFGDKMSPLSDTTNLAPAMAGSDLFEHIRAMLWTTGPTYIIVLIIAAVMGLNYSGGSIDAEQIEAIRQMLAAEFPISPLGLLPPVVVIALAATKRPAIPSIFAGVIVSVLIGIAHGVPIEDALAVLQDGYAPKIAAAISELADDPAAVIAALADANITGVDPGDALTAAATLNELLTKGGIQSMNWTVSLIICALSFAGILERVGYLEVLLGTILKKVTSAGGLVTSAIVSCIVANMFMGDQYVAIVLPGRMFKDRFAKAGLHPRMLSRTLEDSGTLTSALVPWNTCGAFQTSALGVPTVEYLPYAFVNWLNPIIAIIMTYLGIGVSWLKKDGSFIVSKKRPDDAALS